MPFNNIEREEERTIVAALVNTWHSETIKLAHAYQCIRMNSCTNTNKSKA